jgi:hypothetical protein
VLTYIRVSPKLGAARGPGNVANVILDLGPRVVSARGANIRVISSDLGEHGDVEKSPLFVGAKL